MAKKTRKKTKKAVETLTHEDASRKNIPTAELESVVSEDQQKYITVAYKRGNNALEEEQANRNRDLDPQLIWRGKDEQDWSDLVVHAPPIYIQEKIHPKVLIDDLIRRTQQQEQARSEEKRPLLFPDLFADFNGLPDDNARTEFYQHDANWSNRMILGDSLQVMASLAEREGLRGQVQCIYLDPPYGIKFNSNFQWSTTSRDVKDGKADHITREPEQVKAFRDTWRDGIHTYLTYLRDRLTVARDLLSETGSIFVQIGDENVHRVRALMDEVFGPDNRIGIVIFQKTGGQNTTYLAEVNDYLVWYGKNKDVAKFRRPFQERSSAGVSAKGFTKILSSVHFRSRRLTKDEISGLTPIPDEWKLFRGDPICSSEESNSPQRFVFRGSELLPPRGQHWKTNVEGLCRLGKAARLVPKGSSIAYARYVEDYPVTELSNNWTDTMGARDMIYVVQTNTKVV